MKVKYEGAIYEGRLLSQRDGTVVVAFADKVAVGRFDSLTVLEQVASASVDAAGSGPTPSDPAETQVVPR